MVEVVGYKQISGLQSFEQFTIVIFICMLIELNAISNFHSFETSILIHPDFLSAFSFKNKCLCLTPAAFLNKE